MRMPTFCTLFDSNYLTRGLTMLRTLHQHLPDAICQVLCMDDFTFRILPALAPGNVRLVRLAEVESAALLAIKPGRSIAEYCWTLSSYFSAYLMERVPEIEQIIYLDADLMFFSSPVPLLEEAGSASITIVEHRFQEWNRDLLPYGRFNVQWVGFRRDAEGLACLLRWRDQCLEWCFSRLEEGKMGDQKYLDDWPRDYPSVHILQNPGAGVAPWNFTNHPVYLKDGRVQIGGVPLIFYHFHQLQLLDNGSVNHMSRKYSNGRPIPLAIYDPYIASLRRAHAEVQQLEPSFVGGVVGSSGARARRLAQYWLPARVKNLLKRFWRP